MTISGSRPLAPVLCALATLALVASTASAQRPSARVDALRFVGASASAPPQETLQPEELELLVACRRPATLGEVLAQGVAFRSSRIESLQSAGLLVQAGQRFTATLPIWTAEDAASLDAALDPMAATTVNALLPEFRGLLARLQGLGQPEGMPALASWIVYERTWDYLVSTGMIDVRGLVERQRQSHPNRGWWGVLWYREGGAAEAPQRLSTRTDRDRTMLLAWSPEAVPAELDPQNPYAWMARVIGAVRNDRLEMRDRDRFDDLVRQGLLNEQGRLNAPLVKWDPEQQDNLAAAVQSVVELLAVTVTGHLAGDWAPDSLAGADPVVARTIAYHGLAPRILAGLNEAGVRALVDSEGPETRRVATTSEDGESGFDLRPRRLSLFFWKELPGEMQRPAFPLR